MSVIPTGSKSGCAIALATMRRNTVRALLIAAIPAKLTVILHAVARCAQVCMNQQAPAGIGLSF